MTEAPSGQKLDPKLAEVIAVVKDLTRMLEAVRYTVGLGEKQIARIEHARALVARLEGRAPDAPETRQ